MKKSIAKELGAWLLYILIIIGISYLVITFVGQRTQVSGSSMETTLSDGDQLIVDKISYRFRDPSRYDIVVFPYKYEKNTYYIKRIIGLPGETVQIKDGEIYIDGEKLEEKYETTAIEDAGTASEEITMDGDEYFVLGDNRRNSEDSRMADIGNVKRSEIEGKAWFVLSTKGNFGFI